MGQREDIIKIAQKEINYKEGSNNANKFGKWYGMDNNPWCAQFLSWCAHQAGISTDIIPRMAYVPYMINFYKNLKQYYAKSSGYKPQPGDIVFFGSKDHVGLVESCEGNSLVTIEGNTAKYANSSNGDGVYRRNRYTNDSWVLGYGVPKYIVEVEEEEMVYNKVSEVPSWGTATVNKLISKGALKGDTSGLNLNETMLRIFVILDRLGKLD